MPLHSSSCRRHGRRFSAIVLPGFLWPFTPICQPVRSLWPSVRSNSTPRCACGGGSREPSSQPLSDVISLAVEWIIATTAAVVFAHLAIEIVGAAWLGYALLFLLPIAGGLPIGVCQWIVLRRRIDDNGLDPR